MRSSLPRFGQMRALLKQAEPRMATPYCARRDAAGAAQCGV